MSQRAANASARPPSAEPGVIMSDTVSTSGWASAIATPIATNWIISRSLALSPKAIVAFRAMPR